MTKERVEAALNELETAMVEWAGELDPTMKKAVDMIRLGIRMMFNQLPSLTPAQPAEELQ